MPSEASKLEQENSQTQIERGEIHLGDLATALSLIPDASSAQQDLIAQCLGFQLQSTITVASTKYQAVQAAWNRPLLKYQKPQASKPPSFAPTLSMPSVPETITTKADDILEVDLHIDKAPQNSLSPHSEILSQNYNSLLIDNAIPALARQSLFPQTKARGLVSATVTRKISGFDLDIPKLIQFLVRQKPLTKLPVLPRFTVRKGCQLLLDFNEALMPWWEDMQILMQQFQQVLGEVLCPVYEFSQNPLEAVNWTESVEIPWLPVSEKPVLIASDLGVLKTPTGNRIRAGRTEWLDFISRCQKQDTPVIILFPLHPQRCPYDLDKLTPLIHWHPATSAAMIKRLITHCGNRK
jgi:hypothetical protein